MEEVRRATGGRATGGRASGFVELGSMICRRAVACAEEHARSCGRRAESGGM
jgi:hypothetical protein